MSQWGGRCIQR